MRPKEGRQWKRNSPVSLSPPASSPQKTASKGVWWCNPRGPTFQGTEQGRRTGGVGAGDKEPWAQPSDGADGDAEAQAGGELA